MHLLMSKCGRAGAVAAISIVYLGCDVSKPVANSEDFRIAMRPEPGTFANPQTISITASPAAGAFVCWTDNGLAPSSYLARCAEGSASVVVPMGRTVLRAEVRRGDLVGRELEGAYNIATTYPTTSTPVFSAASGIYEDTFSVVLGSGTRGGRVFYTTDGSRPSVSHGVDGIAPASPSTREYVSAIPIASNQVVNAITAMVDRTDSPVAAASYSIRILPPVFSKGSCYFNKPDTLLISSPTGGASIFFTRDGTVPYLSSERYIGPIALDRSQTIRAKAFKSGHWSAVVANTYTLQVDPPVFSLVPGRYLSVRVLTLSSPWPEATIRYTTDGTPATTQSRMYTSAIPLSSSQSISAIVVLGTSTSSRYTAAYTIDPGGIPDLPVVQSVYNATTKSRTVTITCPVQGVNIFYTTDGTSPTAKSLTYTGSFTLAATRTVRAVAIANGVSGGVASQVVTVP